MILHEIHTKNKATGTTTGHHARVLTVKVIINYTTDLIYHIIKMVTVGG